MTRDPWDGQQDRTDAQVWLWRALSEIRVARKFAPDLPDLGLDALERVVQGILDDLGDDAKWAEYENSTSRLVWHFQMVAACRTIHAMRGQFGVAFDRIQADVYDSVWRAWNSGPVRYLEDTQDASGGAHAKAAST
ncbi:hypothetical protein [Burkholderia cepacia]|uniref:hypothetical protein n=1 Tax=Burkholderia cepacia TaxID=292 RepID=UPI000755ABED|nr:hypothetical protein [Burkholderia cepacia]KVS67652.1 hypothetical protein WK41_21940 [Burkholderia cepacia]